MVLAVLYFNTTDPNGFSEALASTSELFSNVQGFHRFEIRRGIEDDNVFLITAEWDSVEDHSRWQVDHAPEFLGVLDPYLAGPPDIKHFA